MMYSELVIIEKKKKNSWQRNGEWILVMNQFVLSIQESCSLITYNSFEILIIFCICILIQPKLCCMLQILTAYNDEQSHHDFIHWFENPLLKHRDRVF